MLKELFKDKKEIENLPVPIREFLDNPDTLQKLNNIAGAFKFGQEMEEKFKDIILRLASGRISLYDLASVLADELEIEFEEATNISDKLYADLLMAVEDDLNAEYAIYQKSIPAEIPIVREADVRKAQKEKGGHAELIDKAVKKFNLSFDEAGRKKFTEIADTFLSGVRTKSQFKNTLTKPAAEGGLQMAHEVADDVAEFLASYSRLQPVIARSEATKQSQEKSLPVQSSKFKVQSFAPPRPVPPNVKIEVNFEKEEKEAAAKKPKIAQIRAEAPKLLSLSFEASAKNDVTEGVQKALQELNYNFPSSELQERLKSVIDARVRNVRTSLQTFDKLTQEIPGGGLGLGKLEADKVSLVLNKYLEEKNKDIYGSKLAEIKQAEAEEKKKQEEKTRASEETEKKRLDERFTKLTGKTPAPPPAVPRSEAPASTTGVIASPSEGVAIPQVLTKQEKFPSASISKKEERNDFPPSEKGDRGGFINPPHPSFSKGGSSSPRPVLEDIKFTPKLAGPLEEIARLTLEDFRKLSGDPKEAVLKIKDKLGLLREESYKKYQAGVDAWYRSPLYGEYLKAMSRSLAAGAPLGDVLKGGQTLTRDEFDAIIESRIE